MGTFSTVLLIANFLFLSANGQIYNDDVITTLMKRLDEQQLQIDTQQREINVLQELVNDQQKYLRLKEMPSNPSSTLKPDTREFVELLKEDTVPNVRSKRQLPIQGTVAFTAVLTHPLNNLGVNQNVVFDLVYTNVGDGYNVHHGVFTAPVPGVYAFHTTMFAHTQQLAFCGIFVNGVNKADVYVQGSSVTNAGSQMVVVELKKGDDVAIQNRGAADVIYSDDNRYTTFSGFLLQDLSDINTDIVG